MYATPRVPSRTGAALGFFRWGLQHGQAQATELGYVPIHSDVVARIEEYLRSRFAEGILVSKQP
jgi:hypothetical protein